MKISEIFYSIQGEGKLAGIPSVFIRTTGCNLECPWCDTPYASRPASGTWREMSVSDIVREAGAFAVPRHCVLTGGEPMISDGVHDLAKQLVGKGMHLTIETNGTISPVGIECDLASVSPKLDNVPGREASVNPDILDEWMDARDFQLKFVVSDVEDIDKIKDCLAGLRRPPESSDVLLMPMSNRGPESPDTARLVVELCKVHGYRYCHRVHRTLYGTRRGV